jgi:hypothetical protein
MLKFSPLVLPAGHLIWPPNVPSLLFQKSEKKNLLFPSFLCHTIISMPKLRERMPNTTERTIPDEKKVGYNPHLTATGQENLVFPYANYKVLPERTIKKEGN